MILGIALLMMYFSCWENHSRTIKKLGDPLVNKVLDFYKENQRYPNLKESEVIFKKVGCKKLRQKNHGETKNSKGEVYERWVSYGCDSIFRTYRYNIIVGDLSVDSRVEAYSISSGKGNTHCSASFYSGRSSGVACQQSHCIDLHPGH